MVSLFTWDAPSLQHKRKSSAALQSAEATRRRYAEPVQS